MGRKHDPDRRTVLKRLGAAAVTGAAVGGTAAGNAAADDGGVEMEPRSVAATARAVPGEEVAVDNVIDANAGGVLELLAEDGLLETASAAALTTETVDPYTDGSVEGVSAYEFGDGETRRLITSDTHVDGGRIELSVEPGRDAVLAEFHRDDGTLVRYADLGNGAQKAVSEDDTCCKCCNCTPFLCSTGSSGTKICYGPERFGCPSATDGCCFYYY